MSASQHTRQYFIAAFVIAIITFGMGFIAGSTTKSPSVKTIDDAVQRLTKSNTPADFSLLTDAWNLIQERYVNKPVDNAKLLQGAVSGLVNSLDDPYSLYLDPKQATSFEDEINGKFEGIGAELGIRDGQVVVIAPLPDTPAENAKIQPGDIITSVDGVPTKDQSLDVVVSHIRGKEGTVVTLDLLRNNEVVQLKITRKKIKVKSVKLDTKNYNNGAVSIVTISSFTQSTASEFREAVQKISLDRPSGIIIDLRNNPGGYLDAAVDVADGFLNDGPVVIEDFGNGKKNTTNAIAGAPLAGYKTAILIDEGSASAAEILAGALRDRIQAKIIGNKSFGKGSVQEIEDLPDGSTIKLTVAHWLTPSGQTIDKNGIKPDLEIDQIKDNDSDEQLQAGLEYIVQR